MVNEVKGARVATAIVVAIISTSAFATVTTVPDSALVASGDYYTDIIGGGVGNPLVMTGAARPEEVGQIRNDDGFSGPINLGFTVSFFGQDYTQFFANNNGNISFTSGLSQFHPGGPQGALVPVIAPFFADVSTLYPSSGLMHLRNDVPDEIIVTWDQVGYCCSDYYFPLLDSFQLVLRGPGYTLPQGEGAIGFFYKSMQWETADYEEPAAVGFGNGSGDGVLLQGSGLGGISGIVNDHYIWFDQNMLPIAPAVNGVPEPSEILLMLLGLLCIGGLLCANRGDQTWRAN